MTQQIAVNFRNETTGDGFDFVYTGPWTVSDDHGSGHRSGTKDEQPPKPGTQVFRRADLYADDEVSWEDKNAGRGTSTHGSAMSVFSGDADAAWPARVFARSMDGIAKADIVFAWLEDREAYGTLVEIGYAKALGKKIVLAHGPSINSRGELWFAFESADFVVSGAADAHAAFSVACSIFKELA